MAPIELEAVCLFPAWRNLQSSQLLGKQNKFSKGSSFRHILIGWWSGLFLRLLLIQCNILIIEFPQTERASKGKVFCPRWTTVALNLGSGYMQKHSSNLHNLPGFFFVFKLTSTSAPLSPTKGLLFSNLTLPDFRFYFHK